MAWDKARVSSASPEELDAVEASMRDLMARAKGDGIPLVVEWLQKMIEDIQEERARRAAEAIQGAN